MKVFLAKIAKKLPNAFHIRSLSKRCGGHLLLDNVSFSYVRIYLGISLRILCSISKVIAGIAVAAAALQNSICYSRKLIHYHYPRAVEIQPKD